MKERERENPLSNESTMILRKSYYGNSSAYFHCNYILKKIEFVRINVGGKSGFLVIQLIE